MSVSAQHRFGRSGRRTCTEPPASNNRASNRRAGNNRTTTRPAGNRRTATVVVFAAPGALCQAQPLTTGVKSSKSRMARGRSLGLDQRHHARQAAIVSREAVRAVALASGGPGFLRGHAGQHRCRARAANGEHVRAVLGAASGFHTIVPECVAASAVPGTPNGAWGCRLRRRDPGTAGQRGEQGCSDQNRGGQFHLRVLQHSSRGLSQG